MYTVERVEIVGSNVVFLKSKFEDACEAAKLKSKNDFSGYIYSVVKYLPDTNVEYGKVIKSYQNGHEL